MPNRASSYPVTSSYPIISEFGFAELCLWENFISFSIHLENSEIEFVISERTCHLINQTLWMTIYPQPEQFLIILFCWKVLNFDNTPKQYHQTTISKKAMYLSFYSEMFFSYFFYLAFRDQLDYQMFILAMGLLLVSYNSHICDK